MTEDSYVAFARLAKGACARIRDGNRNLDEILHELDTEELLAICFYPVLRLDDRQLTACLQELIFRLLKSPREMSADNLRKLSQGSQDNSRLLSESDAARLAGLIEASTGGEFYPRCTKLIRELARLSDTQIHSTSLKTALNKARMALCQGRQAGEDTLYVRILLASQNAGKIPGWVTDLTVGSSRRDDPRLGQMLLDAARAGIRAARQWLQEFEPVDDVHPALPIGLARGRWPEKGPDIDHGSCFLPFAVASAFHLCGLRLPSFVALTGGESQGRVDVVCGIASKLKSARADTIHTVYSVSDETCPAVEEIKHVSINTGSVSDVLSEVALTIGLRLFETGAPALMHHLPPPYVSEHLGDLFWKPEPMPASICLGSNEGEIDVDLSAAWGLDRTRWIGILNGSSQEVDQLLSNFIAFETKVYDVAQTFDLLPPTPARWWMPLPRLRHATLLRVDKVLEAAEREWLHFFAPEARSRPQKLLTPMELLRRFDLTHSVVPGFVVELPCSSYAADVLEKLYELFPDRDLALVLRLLPSADAGPNDLLETLRGRFSDVRVELANARECEQRESSEAESIPPEADRYHRVWRKLFSRLPGESLLSQLLGKYVADSEDLWRRAIFGFCAHQEWGQLNGCANKDKRQGVQVARFSRSLPWGASRI